MIKLTTTIHPWKVLPITVVVIVVVIIIRECLVIYWNNHYKVVINKNKYKYKIASTIKIAKTNEQQNNNNTII